MNAATIVDETEHGMSRLQQAIADGRTARDVGWGDDRRKCLMSAMVPFARSVADCTAAGWPPWLTFLLVWLWQEDVGRVEQANADLWGVDVAAAVRNSDRDWEAIRLRWLRSVWTHGAKIDDTGRLQKAVDAIEGGTVENLVEAHSQDCEGGWWRVAWYNLGPSDTPWDALTAGTAGLTAWDYAFLAAWEAGGLDATWELDTAREETCQTAAKAIVALRTTPGEFPEYLHMPRGRAEPALISYYRGWDAASLATMLLAEDRDEDTRHAMRTAIVESRRTSADTLRGMIVEAIMGHKR